jgi:hypothetical protein
MNKVIFSSFLLLPYLLKGQSNFIDVFVQPGNKTTLFFKSNVKSYAWDQSVSQKVYNAIPGDRELVFFYTSGDTLPAFIYVELENKEKYNFLVVYTSNTTIENEYNLEDSKARGEVMLDQKERRAAGIPDSSYLRKGSRNEYSLKGKPKDRLDIAEKKVDSPKSTEPDGMDNSLPMESDPELSSVKRKRERMQAKKQEEVVKPLDEPEEFYPIRNRKKTTHVKEEKSTIVDNPAAKFKTNEKSNMDTVIYSVDIELMNYLDLQEDGDLAEIILMDPIELANGYKMKRNQSIKIPIEIQQGRIFISLLQQLVISYKGTIGLPLTLNKNNINARFIKK